MTDTDPGHATSSDGAALGPFGAANASAGSELVAGDPAPNASAGSAAPSAAEPGLALGPPARRVVALLGFLALVFWLARPILAPFVVAAVVAYAFTPIVQAVQERTRVRRSVVVVLLYLGALALLIVLAVVIGRKLATEFELLASRGPHAVATLLRQIVGSDEIRIGGTQFSVQELADQLQVSIAGAIGSPSSAIHLASKVAEASLQVILALIVTFYFLLDGVHLRDAALRFLAPASRARARSVGGNIHVVLGRWLRGQLLLIGLVTVIVYVILGPILHVPYALALGILTGVLEIIPLVGPIAAAAIAGTVAFSSGGSGLALTVVAVYFVLRQIEDQVVAPVVIGRAVHLHPVVTIFAVLLGISVWGILGGLLAVPVAAAVNVTLREFYPEAAGPLED